VRYKIIVKNENFIEAVKWAEQHCREDYNFNHLLTENEKVMLRFYFRKKSDATLFALLWS
jgi:hypothetical protein